MEAGQQASPHPAHLDAHVHQPVAASCRGGQQLQQLGVALQQQQLLEVEFVQEPEYINKNLSLISIKR